MHLFSVGSDHLDQWKEYVQFKEGKTPGEEWAIQETRHWPVSEPSGNAWELKTMWEVFTDCRPMWDELTKVLESGPRPIGLKKPTYSKILKTSIDGILVYLPHPSFQVILSPTVTEESWEQAKDLFNRYYPTPVTTTYEFAITNVCRHSDFYPYTDDEALPIKPTPQKLAGFCDNVARACKATADAKRPEGFKQVIREFRWGMPDNDYEAAEYKEAYAKKWNNIADFVLNVVPNKDKLFAYDRKEALEIIRELQEVDVSFGLYSLEDALNGKPVNEQFDHELDDWFSEVLPFYAALMTCALVLKHINKGWRERFWIVADQEHDYPASFMIKELKPWLFSLTDTVLDSFPWVNRSLYNSHREMLTRRMVAAFEKEAKSTDAVQKARESTGIPGRRVMLAHWRDPDDPQVEKDVAMQMQRKTLPYVFVPMIMSFVQGRVKV